MIVSEKNVVLPLIFTGASEGLLEDWIKINKINLDSILLDHGAVLFRGYQFSSFAKIAECLFDEFLSYDYRSTSRSHLGGNIYTSTEYPKDLSIPQHCENSYQRTWPLKLLFSCVTPARRGGNTPLADMLKVTQAIDPDVIKEFGRKKIKYVRNYRPGIDLSWQEVFSTTDKKAVESYCENHHIEYQWIDEGLKTSQVCEAFAVHPKMKKKIWFNQVHLFNVTSLSEENQQILLSMFSEDELPRHSYFGDGSQISSDILAHIRSAYTENMVEFDWIKGDVLLVDNMLVSHGRTPYEGDRKVIVCMAEPYSPY